MSENKSTTTPDAIEAAGHTDWERVLLGDNGIAGTLRMLIYIVGFALVFGSIFYFSG